MTDRINIFDHAISCTIVCCMCPVSRVMFHVCHVSSVTCHVSCAMCHVTLLSPALEDVLEQNMARVAGGWQCRLCSKIDTKETKQNCLKIYKMH